MVSQCTKFEVSRFTRYDYMNGSAKCKNGVVWLFDFNRNHASIFYRFRDIAGYWSKVADFDPPHLHSARSNFAEIFGIRKLESLGYRVVLYL